MSIIQYSYLGKFGRFGNQLFQYAFARSYAEMIGAKFEVPDWIGRRLFVGLEDDDYISCTLPYTEVDTFEWGCSNIDLLGYFQFEKALSIIKKENVHKWFTFKPEFTDNVPARDICAHLRRGDYLSHSDVFCVVSQDSYLKACDTFGLDASSLTWVSEDIRLSGYGTTQEQDMIYDFVTLMKAKVVLRSNSTFSWWAAELGGGDIYSPVIDDRLGFQDVDFVKGNHPWIIYPNYGLKATPKPVCDLVIS